MVSPAPAVSQRERLPSDMSATAMGVDLGPLSELYMLGEQHAQGTLDVLEFQTAKQRALRHVNGWRLGRLSAAGLQFHLNALRASNILTETEFAAALLLTPPQAAQPAT